LPVPENPERKMRWASVIGSELYLRRLFFDGGELAHPALSLRYHNHRPGRFVVPRLLLVVPDVPEVAEQ
jgi:hypothetical protein